MKKSLSVVHLLVCGWWAVNADAHHGIANFDLNRDVSITGEIREIAFVNPHAWLYVDVTSENGDLVPWKCELRGATVLRRSGWTREMFEAGARVTVTGAPDRFEENTCYLGTIRFPDGLTMNRYGQIEREQVVESEDGIRRKPSGVPDLSGDWAGEQRVMTDPTGISGALLPISVADQMADAVEAGQIQSFPGARGTPESMAENPIATAWSRQSIVPLTAAGARAVADFDPSSTDNPRLRCEPTNILFDWTFESVPNRIEQNGDEIRIRYGAMGLERTIHFRERFPTVIRPSRAGYSIAQWEGDDLVVQTRGFLPGILSADTSTPHSDALEVTERFTLDNDGNALVREYVATDPLFLNGRLASRDVVYRSDLPWEPFNCDERSYRSDVDQ